MTVCCGRVFDTASNPNVVCPGCGNMVKSPPAPSKVDAEAARRAGLKWCACRGIWGGCTNPGMCRL